MADQVFPWGQMAQFLQDIGFHAAIGQHMFPMYSHLIISAIFPIFVGAHASLIRPSSAAKPPKKNEGEEEEDDDEDEDEDGGLKQEREGLTPGDAIFLPILAGATLTGLYYLIKYLEDPRLLNKILNWYFSIFGVFATARLLTDTSGTIMSFVFPRTYDLKGKQWEVVREQRLAVSKAGNESLNSPLPGRLALLPLPDILLNTLWTLREFPSRKLRVYLHIDGLIKLEFKVGPLAISSLFMALFLELYFNLVEKPWWLVNIFGFSFAYSALQYVTPTTSLTGTLILGSLFFYDIYFVFFTPMMKTVATELEIPAKLVFPRPKHPSESNDSRPTAMLGLGDIVLPGLLIGFALRFDLFLFYLRQQKQHLPRRTSQDAEGPDEVVKAPWTPVRGRWGDKLWTSSRTNKEGRFPKKYFYSTLAGYVSGLIVTLLVMQVFGHAQPALLYLVPGVLGSLYTTAWWNGDLRTLWDFNEMDGEEGEEKRIEQSGKEDEKESAFGGWGASLFGRIFMRPDEKTITSEVEEKDKIEKSTSSKSENGNSNKAESSPNISTAEKPDERHENFLTFSLGFTRSRKNDHRRGNTL